MGLDAFKTKVIKVDQPARRAVAITPDDNNDLNMTSRSLYVGGQGDITVVMADDTVAVLFPDVVGYNVLMVKRIMATGTTATGIVALY
jgi:hypothetical protein